MTMTPHWGDTNTMKDGNDCSLLWGKDTMVQASIIGLPGEYTIHYIDGDRTDEGGYEWTSVETDVLTMAEAQLTAEALIRVTT
jgi:hypothetical protein